MTADILDFCSWRACLRSETQATPEPALSRDERRALRMAEIVLGQTHRAAARFNRQCRHKEALASLQEGYADLRTLVEAYGPNVVLAGMLQDMHAKIIATRKVVRQRAKR